MCRLAGLAARPERTPPPLSALLFDPPHSLMRQARAPREQRRDSVNVDGTGIAWWADDAPEPLRYTTDLPYWSDPNLPWLAPRLRAHAQVALVRSATTGIGYGAPYVSPFVHGRLACAHNGWIGAFRERTARPLLERLPDDVFAAYHAASDSLAVLLTLVAEVARDPGAPLVDAVHRALDDVADICVKHDAEARLNVLVGDGTRLVAARSAVDEQTDSLYVLARGRRWPDANVIASEPLDEDPGWTPVPPGALVELTPDAVTVTETDDLVR